MYFYDSKGADQLKAAIEIRASRDCGATPDELGNLLLACSKEQIQVIRTLKDEPLAYYSFAKISKYTLRLLVRGNKEKLLNYEMKEGKIFYLLDVVICKGKSRSALPHILNSLLQYRLIAFKKRGCIRLYRRSGDRFKRINKTHLLSM